MYYRCWSSLVKPQSMMHSMPAVCWWLNEKVTDCSISIAPPSLSSVLFTLQLISSRSQEVDWLLSQRWAYLPTVLTNGAWRYTWLTPFSITTFLWTRANKDLYCNWASSSCYNIWTNHLSMQQQCDIIIVDQPLPIPSISLPALLMHVLCETDCCECALFLSLFIYVSREHLLLLFLLLVRFIYITFEPRECLVGTFWLWTSISSMFLSSLQILIIYFTSTQLMLFYTSSLHPKTFVHVLVRMKYASEYNMRKYN